MGKRQDGWHTITATTNRQSTKRKKEKEQKRTALERKQKPTPPFKSVERMRINKGKNLKSASFSHKAKNGCANGEMCVTEMRKYEINKSPSC